MPKIIPALSEVQVELCKRSLHYYVRQAWEVVEPETKFVDNWHIGMICEYLQAVTAGEIKNLIINIPPRHMKSLLVCVMWPTWSWIINPQTRWLTGSYAEPLAVRDAVKSRRIIQSQWYRDRFGQVFSLQPDQNLKSRYENDHSGYRLAFGLGGSITGEGGDIIVVDDPLKAQDADSEIVRSRINATFDGTVSTRANDPRNARRVIIMQRLHQDDLTGHLLEKSQEPGANKYDLVVLPTEYEPGRMVPILGKSDPRTVAGELLWPERFGPDQVAAAKADLGARGYAGQHAQRPAPAGGNIYQVDWWREGRNRLQYVAPGSIIGRWLSWDTALTDNTGSDQSAMIVGELLDDYSLYIRSVSAGKFEFPQLAQSITDEAARWDYDGKLRGIIIEDKASGISALQTIAQSASDRIAELLIPFDPGQRSKEARARQASLWCERDCIYLPTPQPGVSWLYDFETELYNFPGSRYRDSTDSFGQLILYLEHLLAEGWRARVMI